MNEKYSRRSFIEILSGGAASATIPFLTYERSVPDERHEVERKGELASIETEDVTHDMLYGAHGPVYGTMDIGLDPDQVSEDLDGVFFEVTPYLEKPGETLRKIAEHPFYEPIMEKLERNKIPVYFTDIEVPRTVTNFEIAHAFSESGISVGATKKIKEITEEDKYVDLKEGFLAGLGGWAATPGLAYSSLIASNPLDFGKGFANRFQKFSERIHPETYLNSIKLRNKGVAQKQQSIIEMENEDDPYYLSIWGSLHTRFEDQLQIDEETRLSQLEAFNPDLKNFANDQHFYRSVKLEYHENWGWETWAYFTEPSMEKMLEK